MNRLIQRNKPFSRVTVQGNAITFGKKQFPAHPVASPVVSGTPAVGQALNCSTGEWTGTPAPVFTYQWRRDNVPITGETASSYIVVAGDVGKTISCAVTGANILSSVTILSNGLLVT